MEDKLKELYYDANTGLTGFKKFWERIKAEKIKASYKDVKEFYKNQEITQISKKPTAKKTEMLKIVAPPLSFQVDIMFFPEEFKMKNKGIFKFLTLIDILSRKAFMYPMKTQKANEIIEKYKEFLKDLKKDVDKMKGTENEYSRETPLKITADQQFDFKEFQAINSRLKIDVDTQTAKDDHISGGNRLGIIDRFTRTFKGLVSRLMHGSNDLRYLEALPQLLQNYNNTKHEGLGGQTPNEVFEDRKKRYEIFKKGMEENMKIYETRYTFEAGDKVRAVKGKGAFDKEGPRFTKTIYEVIE